MLDNFGDIAAAKIIVGHEVKMRVDFIRIIGRKILRHGELQAFTLDSRLFVIRLLVRKITGGLVEQLPDKRLFPIRPRLCACALTIGQGKQHQCVEVFLVLHDAGQLGHRRGVIQISLLRDHGEGEVVIDQQN